MALLLFITTATVALAQGKTVADRVGQVHSSFETIIKADERRAAQVDGVFTDFFTAQEQIRQNLQAPKAPGMSGGFASGFAPQQDFQSIRQKNETLVAERDRKLKKILTAEEYKRWKDEVEPALHRR